MKRKRFTEEQIIAVLREHEAGAKAGDLARKHGISEATLYNWKAKYGGMDVSDAKRLKALEDENAKLKKLLAETMLADVSAASSADTARSATTREVKKALKEVAVEVAWSLTALTRQDHSAHFRIRPSFHHAATRRNRPSHPAYQGTGDGNPAADEPWRH